MAGDVEANLWFGQGDELMSKLLMYTVESARGQTFYLENASVSLPLHIHAGQTFTLGENGADVLEIVVIEEPIQNPTSG